MGAAFAIKHMHTHTQLSNVHTDGSSSSLSLSHRVNRWESSNAARACPISSIPIEFVSFTSRHLCLSPTFRALKLDWHSTCRLGSHRKWASACLPHIYSGQVTRYVQPTHTHTRGLYTPSQGFDEGLSSIRLKRQRNPGHQQPDRFSPVQRM